jgi:hypothetical protein
MAVSIAASPLGRVLVMLAQTTDKPDHLAYRIGYPITSAG